MPIPHIEAMDFDWGWRWLRGEKKIEICNDSRDTIFIRLLTMPPSKDLPFSRWRDLLLLEGNMYSGESAAHHIDEDQVFVILSYKGKAAEYHNLCNPFILEKGHRVRIT